VIDPIYYLFFDTGSARIAGEGVGMIDRAADMYRQYGFVTVEITAHADNVGPSAYNRRLSARRARAVAAELVRRGIPRGVMILRPMGETHPMVATPDGVADAQNRYVLIYLSAPTPR
jgi:outer membrane protein OmpA-like peptidoglycan-associated protein